MKNAETLAEELGYKEIAGTKMSDRLFTYYDLLAFAEEYAVYRTEKANGLLMEIRKGIWNDNKILAINLHDDFIRELRGYFKTI